MAAIQLVVFDMAGTTVQDHHEVEKCFAQACRDTGLVVSDERILALQGYAKNKVFQLLWSEQIGEEHPEYTENVALSYDTFRLILEEHYRLNPVLPTEGCLETLAWLREKNIKIALTTGFYRKVTNLILDKLGWLNGLDANYLNTSGQSIIDVSIASDEVPMGRPEPYLIQRAMRLLNVSDPLQVINIGDTPSDLKSGIRARVKYSLGVINGTHTKQQLAIYRNDGLLPNIAAIRDFID
ncbi:MAG: HAD hydrolase-like protein [Spirosomataceae bacterium]